MGDSSQSFTYFEYHSQHAPPVTLRESLLAPTDFEDSDTDYTPRDIDPEPFDGEEVRENIQFCSNFNTDPVEVIDIA